MWRIFLGAWLTFALVQTPPQIRGFYRIEEPSVAFGDLVQSDDDSSNGTGSVAPSLAVGATAGNLLIAGISSGVVDTFGADPAGFTPLTETPAASTNMVAKWYYKIATGGEQTVTMTTSGATGRRSGILMEVEGPFAASPLDVTAEDETNVQTVVTSQSSGTTASTAQADALAVAFFAGDLTSTLDGTRTYTNGFTEAIIQAVTTVSALAVFAKKVLSATGTQETTYGVTDTGDEMYGAIAVFKAASGGGTAVVQASTLTTLGVQ